MIQIGDEVFNDGLPDSITFDPQVTTIGDVSDIRSLALLPIIDQLRVLCNINAQPEAILDLLAFQFQVLFYSGTFGITDPVARLAAKQDLIANNFDFHAHLGTPATMQKIISAIFEPALIQEWFAYGGTANHYRILFPNVISGTLQTQIGNTQRVIKRASQAFDGFFVYNVAGPETVYVAVGVFTQIWQILPVGRAGAISAFVSGGTTVVAIATVQSASSRVTVAMGANMVATSQQIVAGAIHATIVGRASMTNTAKILRGLAVLIKAGHG